MKQPKNLSGINWDIVLYQKEGRVYSNKKLREFDADDFADYVLDHENIGGNGKLTPDNYLYNIEYLQYIPNAFARVYLYGVWSVFEEWLQLVEN